MQLITFASLLTIFFVEVQAAPVQKLIQPYSKKAGEAYLKLPSAKKGGVFYGHLVQNLKSLNPLTRQDLDEQRTSHYLYAKLMEQDGETGEYFPLLAEKVEVSKDYKVMVYTLRKDATWDDGTPITADDAEFTYQKLMDPKVEAAPLRAYFGAFHFEKVDQHTFKLSVENPNVNTLSNFNEDFGIIQKKQFADAPDFNKSKGIVEPVGSGPYRFKAYSRDQKIELERRKDWWGYKVPQMKNLYNFDMMVFRIIPDQALAYEKFLKGDIDVLPMNPETYVSKAKGSDEDKVGVTADSGKAIWATHFKTSSPAPYSYVGWNMKRPLFASKKIRQALAMLIDYDQILAKVYFDEGVRCLSPFGTLSPNMDPAVKSKSFKLDPVKALEILKEEGWADTDADNVLDKVVDGKKVNFEFTLRYNSENPLRAKIAQMIKEQFKKAGILVNVQSMEWNTLMTNVKQHEFDAIISGWANGNLNADAAQLWHSKSYENQGSNYIGYSDPQVDQWIADSQKEMNPQKRFKIIQKIGAKLYDDQPYAFLGEIPGFMLGINSRIRAKRWVMKYDSAPPLWQYSIE